MITAGDADYAPNTEWTLHEVLGADYPWFVAVGNHELPDLGEEPHRGANMAWLRDRELDPNGVGTPPDLVNRGPSGCPETTYSFDHHNAHFVILNEYCDVNGDTSTSGRIPDHLYDWLVADLAATDRRFIFVVGHEPAYPQPDADSGRRRHMSDSLNQFASERDRFWELLVEEGVTAYFCGHTHNYSAERISGVWQIDAGHARGAGDVGAPSTFVRTVVAPYQVNFEIYRTTGSDPCDYARTDAWAADMPSASRTVRFTTRPPYLVLMAGGVALVDLPYRLTRRRSG